MASGLFGSGPQSNILNTVQSSYNAMLNAERQKGVAMSTAMGAFGQAISPKAIGMRKFKDKFADADWSGRRRMAVAGGAAARPSETRCAHTGLFGIGRAARFSIGAVRVIHADVRH